MTTHASWICPQCRDYNLGEDTYCSYCGQSAEFLHWLDAVDKHLADCDEGPREAMPYLLHQWWELYDHSMSPEDAARAAWLLSPASTVAWPEHLAYHRFYCEGGKIVHVPPSPINL